ncbi:MAG: TAT-variant-translocated molybdopterin oxidoreductase [Phycisphaeraceae bacterium]
MPSLTPNITGRAYWRSLEEYADSPAFRDLAGLPGPSPIDPSTLSVTRRHFLQLMGASMSLAGLTLAGCRRWDEEKLAPFAQRPEGRVPGQPEYFASMLERGGASIGVLVESFDGRPIKVEGNPEHPYSQGATDAWAQASILSLYDPDRSRFPMRGRGEARQRTTWQDLAGFVHQRVGARASGDSSRLAVLTPRSDSPTRARLKAQFHERHPEAGWYEWEAVNRDNALAGTRQAFGRALRPAYRLDRAAVIACFDADPLLLDPAAVRHARDWATTRKQVDTTEMQMSRLYAAEPTFTVTGSVADERLAVRVSEVGALVRGVAARLGVIAGDGGSLNGSTAWVEKLAADLRRHEGEAVLIVGESQPPEVHALAWAINERIGAIGRTVDLYDEPGAPERTQREQIAELARRIDAGEIDTLLVLGGNPAYDAPAELAFADKLAQVEEVIHLGAYADETALTATWHVPAAHELEAWGDGRAWDGTVSVQQPLILPLFGGRSAIELLATALGADAGEAEGYELVRATFRDGLLAGGSAFERDWRRVLHRGLVPDSAAEPATDAQAQAPADVLGLNRAAGGEFELVLRPDAAMYDGRWANNGWMQELPGPITKLTWGNAAQIAVADARRLGLEHGDVVRLRVGERELEIPIFPMPGQATGTVVVSLGYGRRAAGHVGNGVGVDTYQLRTSDAMHVAAVAVEAAGRREALATTQNHHLIDATGEQGVTRRTGERGASGYIIKEMSLADYRQNPHRLHGSHHGDLPLQLYDPPYPDDAQAHEAKRPGGPVAFNEPHAWGMSVDMNSCIGCNACVVACQAENNIPVVGKDQVLVNRELHWLRIDRYFKGDPEAETDIVHQPMMCVHCENAPCEQVCPVNAAIHDAEGLNLQVYNRCVGTRYCSNNCPYKVRRFNYFDFHAKDPRGQARPWLDLPDTQSRASMDRIKAMVFNPDVTVRMRGVMEKCTYCMQRLSRAKIAAKNEWSRGEREEPLVRDGEVVTACQQACPTQAITFGDLNKVEAVVSKEHASPRAYQVLNDDLNTRPRTRHLAKLRNPAV